QDLPGHELFQYTNGEGDPVAIDSGMVNQYLRETTGEDITAKDFRTWHGTVHAAEYLCSYGESRAAKDNVVSAIQAVAERLGNRPATCRKYYVHPAVLDLYMAGGLTDKMSSNSHPGNTTGLTPPEKC